MRGHLCTSPPVVLCTGPKCECLLSVSFIDHGSENVSSPSLCNKSVIILLQSAETGQTKKNLNWGKEDELQTEGSLSLARTVLNEFCPYSADQLWLVSVCWPLQCYDVSSIM